MKLSYLNIVKLSLRKKNEKKTNKSVQKEKKKHWGSPNVKRTVAASGEKVGAHLLC